MKRRLLLLQVAALALSLTARCQDPVTENGNKVAAYLLDGHRNEKSGKKTSLKFEFGATWEQVPCITNTTSADGVLNPYSTYDNLSYPAATTALQLWWTPVRFVSLRLKPAVTYGMPIGSGESGYYFDYSGDAKLLFGTTVKLFGEAAYINRAGTYTRDQDAANASLGISTSDGITTDASFAYSTTRLGGGLYFETSKEKDSYIELGAFKETTTLSSGKSPINSNVPISPTVYKATFVIGKFYLEGCYSPNYPLDGTALYNTDSQGAAQKSFLEIKIGAIFNL